MSRYQPPHMRQAGSSHASPTAVSTSWAPSGMQSRWAPKGLVPTTVDRGEGSGERRPVTPRLAAPSVLASPASDLKPRKATKEWTKPCEMEMLASVSRSGGDGQEGDALKDYATQQAFRIFIDERLAEHHTRFKSAPHSAPQAGQSGEIESLKSIVLLFRKLREGVTASHRIDGFAVEVYESSALLAVLTHDASQLVSTLSALVPSLYNAYNASVSSSLEASTSRLSINGSRQTMFVTLFLLYHLCHLDSQTAFWSHYRELTNSDNAFASPASLRTPVLAAKALSPRSPSPQRFFAVLRDPAIDPYQRVMLSWAEDRMRDRGLAVLRKAYIDAGQAWVFTIFGFSDDTEGSHWIKSRGLRIEDGKVKFRS